jgi:Sulfotransferase family
VWCDGSVSGTGGDGRLTVVYLAGAQHCGSTLLDAVLGNATGARSLGEAAGFQRYESFPECDCRRPAASCGPCRAVVAALDAGPGLAAFRRVAGRPLKERRLHWTVVGTRARAEYAAVADAMFEAVAADTGCTTLVDSSKNLSRAAALVHDGRHDVRVVHLVRDGRGYLRSKRRRAGDGAGGIRHRLPIALAPWLAKNVLAWTLLRRRVPHGRYLLCRYEDLMADPAAELARIGRFAGLDVTGLAERATGDGVPRLHLFEPRRRVDYRWVRLEPGRLASQRATAAESWRYWLSGGAVSARWGYRRRQAYPGSA